MQLFFSEKQVALHLGCRPSGSTAAARTSYEHNDKANFLFSKQPDRLGPSQPPVRRVRGRAVLQHIRLDLLPTSRMSAAMPPLPPYAAMVLLQQYWGLGKMQSSVNHSAVGYASHRKCCDTNTRKQPLCDTE
jgi:hypothetical protein